MNIDTLRTLINDVDPDNQVFTDDQLEDFLELEGNLYSAAAAACQALAAQYALKKKLMFEVSLSKISKSMNTIWI